ncbi:hypothetical protein WKH63_18425 [Pantoea agglomerans]|uniref:hypothetical protein n=1 Tax=Pantoea TaxID=53335 RepID=UPI001EE5D3BA|nr:hypothetical protein [Pantoea ananatis]PKC35773.1 hypothetical protein V462_11330 [Pantoea ananatis 15320]
MIKLPSVLIIDDILDELNVIRDSFAKIGLPCLPIQYSNDLDNASGIDHANLEKITPRIIITDLNLTELTTINAANLAGPILKLINKIDIQGPYLLYFWSKNSATVQEVKNIIEQRISNKNLLPLSMGILDKADLLHDHSKLELALDKIISENPLFESIFNWECRINSAAQNTINSLYKLTSPDSQTNPEDYVKIHSEKIMNVLALIANETLGHQNAAQYPSKSVDLGLLPVLSDSLQNIESGTWDRSITKIGEKTNVDDEMKAKLNSFYHIEITQDAHSKSQRGVFLPINENYASNKENIDKMCSKLGVENFNEILASEFINFERIGNQDILKNLKIGFVELSAECDHAQKKIKLHRYVISALIPEILSEHCKFGRRITKHDGIYRLPTFEFNGSKFFLMLSFKYQIGTKDIFLINSENIEHKWFGNPLFRLRDQILSDISFKCSQYSSRPGIVSF